MRGAVGVAFEGDGRHGDDGRLGQSALQRVVLRLAVAQADPPAVVVDHDRHVIGVVERGGAALERGVVEVPLRRGRPPDEPRELAPVALVPGPAALGREVVLVPPLPLGLRRQRQLAGLLAADEISAHGDEPGAPPRPERGDDVGRPRSPVGAGDDRRLDPEGVHQRDGVDRQDRLLPVAERLVGEKARRAVAAQVRDDHPVARRRQPRRDLVEGVDVVRPAMQQHDRRTIAGTDVGVSDVQHAGLDLLDTRRDDLAHVRSDLNAARSSSTNSWGCSQAAKWPPRSTSLKWMRLSG